MKLKVFQYEQHPLFQITNGRAPHTEPEHADGWKLRTELDPSVESLGTISGLSPTRVLSTIERDGYIALSNAELSSQCLSKYVPSS